MSNIARKCLWFLAAFLGMTVAAVVAHDLYWQRKVAAYRAELKSKGERLEINEVVDRFPPEVYQALDTLLGTMGRSPPNMILSGAMRMVAPGKAIVGHRQPVIWAPGDKTTNTWEEMDEQVAGFRSSLAASRKALLPEQIAARLDYSQGFSVLLPQLAPMKGLSQRFACAVMDDLHHDDFPAALTNLLAGLSVPKAIAGEHFLISELVRIAISAIMFSATWEALQSPACDDAALVQIAAACQAQQYFAPVIRSLELERAMGLDTLKKMRRSQSARVEMIGALTSGGGGMTAPSGPADFGGLSQAMETIGNYLKDFSGRVLLGARCLAWRYLWASEDEYYLLHLIQEIIDGARAGLKQQALKPCREQEDRVQQDIEKLAGGNRLDRFLFTRNTVPSWNKAFDKAAAIEVQKQLVVAAVAIRRHELRHGRLPATLDQLMPEFLASVPRDWMDGASLRYRPGTNGQFVLYSVGRDFKDGGGDGAMMDEYKSAHSVLLGKDIVWPMPATAEEIAEAAKASKGRR
ncbi:MAG TPA: hypothetical protein VHH73_11670 [Verrucomicrobiae bacterium]|nr:hypothetical protein [Verrucomicrobiae bacterium]